MMRLFLGMMTVLGLLGLGKDAHAANMTAYDFNFISIDGITPIPLSDYKDKVILVVNTASHCGFTPQYDGLEKLYQDYKDKGLVIIGVPSNDFGAQEPESEAKIKEFCRINYGVTFLMTKKYAVTGKDAHPFYQWARDKAGFLGGPKWNFHKYLIGRDGHFIDGFASTTTPNSTTIHQAIDKALKK